MVAHQLISVWRSEIGSVVSEIQLSADGQFLLTKGDGRIAYLNWGNELLWQGQIQGELQHLSTIPERDQVLAASDVNFYSFDRNGRLLENSLMDQWIVQRLHVGTHSVFAVASKDKVLGCLDDQGQLLWQHNLRNTVRTVAISPNGDLIVAGGADGQIIGLNSRGGVLWTSRLNKPIVSASAGNDIVAVADTDNILHCLDGNGQELCNYKLEGSLLQSVAVSAVGKYIAVGSETELSLFFYTAASVIFMPVHPSKPGAKVALEDMGRQQIYNIIMNHTGELLIVEGKDEHFCYDLEGSLLWRCPKISIAPPLPPPPDDPPLDDLPPPDPSPEEQLIRNVRQTFAQHVYAQSGNKADAAKARQDVRLEGEILDLYFDGKGYLFVPNADIETIQRAVRLIKHTNIYLVCYHTSSEIVRMAKRTNGIELYRLSDMIKTTGWLGGSDFETFMLMQGRRFTRG